MEFMPTHPALRINRRIFLVACFGITNLHKMTIATASPVLFFVSFAFHVLKFDMTVTIISTLQH